MTASPPSPSKRARVLVDLGRSDSPIARAMPVNRYQRARRIRDLLALGIASESIGLRVEWVDGLPVLRGVGLPIERPPAAVPQVDSPLHPETHQPTPVHLPPEFLSQFDF